MSDTVLDSMLVKLLGDGSSYFNMMKQAEKTSQRAAGIMGGLSREINMYSSAIKSYGVGIFNWTTGLTALVGLGSIVSGLHLGAKLASDFEQAEIQFGVMLHSTEKAAEMMKSIEKFAAETPLNTAGINQAAKTLLQFNVAGENVMPLLKVIGNAVGGDNERFQRMSLAFGQMSAAGRLMGQDLMQMVNAGFNPLQEIAKSTGKTIAQLHQEMEHGAISTNMVMKAFESASKAGGQFDGLMEKQSKSLGGLFSTLSDNVQIQLKRLTGFVFEAINLKSMLKNMSDFVNGSQKMLESWAMYFIKQAKDIYNYVAPTFIAIAQVVGGAISVVAKYWNSLSSEFKTTLVVISLLVVAFGPIVAAIVTLGSWIPIVTAMVVTGASAILTYFGGIEAVWQSTLVAVTNFYTFIHPLTEQFIETAIELWNLLGYAAQTVLSMIAETASWVFGETNGYIQDTATWVRDGLIESLLLAQFTFERFGDIANLALLMIGYELVKLGAQIQYLFTVVAPVYLQWFIDNGLEMFIAYEKNVATIWINIGKNIMEIMSEVWDYISSGGTDRLEIAWKPLTDGFVKVMKELPVIANREIGKLENGMENEVAALALGVLQDFAKFKEGKGIEQFVNPEKLKEPIKNILKTTDELGLKMGDGIAEGVKHGTHQLDAVLLGSAKSFDVFWDYYAGKRGKATSLPEKLAKGLKGTGKPKADGVGGGFNPIGPALPNPFDKVEDPEMDGYGGQQETALQKRLRLQDERDQRRAIVAQSTNGKFPTLGFVDPKSRTTPDPARTVENTAGTDAGNAPLFSSIDTSLKRLVTQGDKDTDKTEITVVDLTEGS